MEIDKGSRDYSYIAKYWELLAACAWREYKTHGRGALLVHIDGEVEEEAIFLPLAMLTTHPRLEGFALLAKAYDPRLEIVVIFLRPPSEVTAHKGSIPEKGTPPELYERIKEVLELTVE